jgi:hypothetical protein
LKTFGEYFDEAMRQRMQRDKVPYVRRAVIDRGSYRVRGYIVPPIADEDVDYFYLRRDGRIGRSWGPHFSTSRP